MNRVFPTVLPFVRILLMVKLLHLNHLMTLLYSMPPFYSTWKCQTHQISFEERICPVLSNNKHHTLEHPVKYFILKRIARSF